MQEMKPLLVIVTEQKGVEALSDIPGVKVVMAEAGKPIPSDANDAEILVVGPAEQQSEVDDALIQISQLPSLKLLQTLGQGTEQWDGLLPSELRLSTARGAHGGSTAEWALMALLALLRGLPSYIQNQKNHLWKGQRAQTLLGANVIVYGASDLGNNVRDRLLPFGAKVTMVGTHAREGVVDDATARTFLGEVDAVIVALPLTPDTKHIVDAKFLASLSKGTIVINAGRGGLIDQNALMKELQAGRLLAALDVMTPEPLPSDSPLWDAPGLLITPHVGGNTIGADDRAWHVASERIRDYVEGKLNDF
jgi:phosphoglycerate dehydrogenase-like enzyme